MHTSRRHLLRTLGTAGVAALVAGRALDERVLAYDRDEQPLAEHGDDVQPGRLLFDDERAMRQRFGVKSGTGLDARQFTDLSRLRPGQLITPNAEAYIRTECPPAVLARGASANEAAWRIALSGRDARGPREGVLTFGELMRLARPMGAHLFECAGNDRAAGFGLMSVAEWDGVPLSQLVERLGPTARDVGLLVVGHDHAVAAPGSRSLAGASWILPLDALDRLGAFLAVRMNGAPLPPDHGHPVRLVVPGWYACAWIKWVRALRLVGPDEPRTTQMREFASRTHQTADHARARDYAPPAIDAAAMPIRVDGARTATGIRCRLAGIVWGGTRPVERLEIQLGSREDAWHAVELTRSAAAPAIWSLWQWTWLGTWTGTPPRAARVEIALRIADAGVSQRRLAAGYYRRSLSIELQ